MNRYFFTFGIAEHFPFKNGYIIVNAKTLSEAIKLFRIQYPDNTEGVINCSDYYTERQWNELAKNHSLTFFGELFCKFAPSNLVVCAICGRDISDSHDQHDARPVAKGKCCSLCNYQKVVPERIRLSNKDGVISERC